MCIRDSGNAGGDGRFERQLRLQLADVTQFRQRRQFVQTLEAEVVEEGLGGGQQLGLARYVAVAHHEDPVAFFQGFDDVAVDRHPCLLYTSRCV